MFAQGLATKVDRERWRAQRKCLIPSIRHYQHHSLNVTPDAGLIFMAASRRDPLIREQRRDDELRGHHHRGDRKPHRSRSSSLRRRVADFASDLDDSTSATKRPHLIDRTSNRPEGRYQDRERRSRSPRRYRSRSPRGIPKTSSGEHRRYRGREERKVPEHRVEKRARSPILSVDRKRSKSSRTPSLDSKSRHHLRAGRENDKTLELFPDNTGFNSGREQERRYSHHKRKSDELDRRSPAWSRGREHKRHKSPHHHSHRSKRHGSRESLTEETRHEHRYSRKHASKHSHQYRSPSYDNHQSAEEYGSWDRPDSPQARHRVGAREGRVKPQSTAHGLDTSRDWHEREYSRDKYYRTGYRPSEERRDRNRRERSSSSDYNNQRRPTMPETQPIQSVLDDRDTRGRPITSIDDSRSSSHRGRGGFDRGRRGGHSYHQPPPPGPPHIDTRFTAGPQYGTPSGSFHGSPTSASPYGSQWGGSPQAAYYHAAPAHAYAQTPPRQHSYPPPTHAQGFYQQPYGPSPPHPGYGTPPYRGGHSSMRGGYPSQPDRRFSGGSVSGSPTYGGSTATSAQGSNARGRGHYQNLQWTASGGTRGGKQPDSGHHSHQSSREASVQSTGPPPPPPPEPAPPPPEDEYPFRSQKEFRGEPTSQFEVPQNRLDVNREPQGDGKEGAKFSFAFNRKAAAAPTTKPVADLTQKMKEPPAPPRKEPVADSFRKPIGTHPRDSQFAGKSHLGGRPDARDRNRYDRFDDKRREGHPRFDHRQDARDGRQAESKFARHGHEQDREHERLFEVPREKEKPKGPIMIKIKRKIRQRKPRPQLTQELKASKSIYFRKQGNESVVGSGTYGKVYKALHVYKNELVALKKIRMEGEKDGFPVTAVREMKLLQTLRHENVVRLKETMVENNDCYMVFEYISHDLTGLLNHPTFKLEDAHKKHLCYQLFQALDYLHRRGVLHRDLKAANILVSNTGVLKLADFGLARFYEKHHNNHYTNRVITIWYRSPELLLGETQYGPAVDMWSAACVLIEIFTRHAIFPGDGTEINQIEKIYNLMGTPTRKQWPGIVDMAWFELLKPREARANLFAKTYKERLSPAAFDMLASMFRYNPDQRPSAKEALEHAYFTREEPAMKQVTELKSIKGDWHEFESKALRKANERKQREAAAAEREKAKRRASSVAGSEKEQRDAKKVKSDALQDSDKDLIMSEEGKAESSGIVPIPPRPGPESPAPRQTEERK